MDAMSGQGELGDRGLGRTYMGWMDWAEYMTGRTEADRADSRADGAD